MNSALTTIIAVLNHIPIGFGDLGQGTEIIKVSIGMS